MGGRAFRLSYLLSLRPSTHRALAYPLGLDALYSPSRGKADPASTIDVSRLSVIFIHYKIKGRVKVDSIQILLVVLV